VVPDFFVRFLRDCKSSQRRLGGRMRVAMVSGFRSTISKIASGVGFFLFCVPRHRSPQEGSPHPKRNLARKDARFGVIHGGPRQLQPPHLRPVKRNCYQRRVFINFGEEGRGGEGEEGVTRREEGHAEEGEGGEIEIKLITHRWFQQKCWTPRPGGRRPPPRGRCPPGWPQPQPMPQEIRPSAKRKAETI
jgi:hypothetical protein